MDQAKYELIKAVRKAKDALRAQRSYGNTGYLAKKIAARRKYFKQKRKATDKNFEIQKKARISREHGRWNRKSVKWTAKGTKWGKHWEHKSAKFNARMVRRFG